MRLRCLLGMHEWEPTGEVRPPDEWAGLPAFHLKRCVHCPADSYDMVWPEGMTPPL